MSKSAVHNCTVYVQVRILNTAVILFSFSGKIFKYWYLLQNSNLRNLQSISVMYLMSPHLTCLIWWHFPLVSLFQHFTLCNGDLGYLRRGILGNREKKKAYLWSHCYLLKSDVLFLCLCFLDLAASVVIWCLYEFSSVDCPWIKLFSTMDFFLHSNTLDNSI